MKTHTRGYYSQTKKSEFLMKDIQFMFSKFFSKDNSQHCQYDYLLLITFYAFTIELNTYFSIYIIFSFLLKMLLMRINNQHETSALRIMTRIILALL